MTTSHNQKARIASNGNRIDRVVLIGDVVNVILNLNANYRLTGTVSTGAAL